MLPSVKSVPCRLSHFKIHQHICLQLFWAVFTSERCLSCPYFSPDSDETTFPLNKSILWLWDLYFNQKQRLKISWWTCFLQTAFFCTRHMWPWTTKPVISSMSMFVAIAKHTLHGSNYRFLFYAKNPYAGYTLEDFSNLIRSSKCGWPQTWGQKNPRFNRCAPIVCGVPRCDKFSTPHTDRYSTRVTGTREIPLNLSRLENKQDFFSLQFSNKQHTRAIAYKWHKIQ